YPVAGVHGLASNIALLQFGGRPHGYDSALRNRNGSLINKASRVVHRNNRAAEHDQISASLAGLSRAAGRLRDDNHGGENDQCMQKLLHICGTFLRMVDIYFFALNSFRNRASKARGNRFSMWTASRSPRTFTITMSACFAYSQMI